MNNNGYQIVNESVILTEISNAVFGGLGAANVALGSWNIYLGHLAKKIYKKLQSVETRDDAINILNEFYIGFKLSADKLNDPKEVTLWKRLWSRKAVVYNTLNQEDWKERLLKEFKDLYRSCFLFGAAGIGVGAATTAYTVTHL